MHQRRRLLAALSQKQAARATIPLAVRVAHRWAVLHASSKCDAQGVTRARIRTSECLGRDQEVALAAYALAEALAGGAELQASRTCIYPLAVIVAHRWAVLHVMEARLMSASVVRIAHIPLCIPHTNAIEFQVNSKEKNESIPV
jgi:hypothetical protein